VSRVRIRTQEQRGAAIFNGAAGIDCQLCHDFNALASIWPTSNGLDITSADPGAGNGKFRPAALRNIAKSAPYMHDGRFATLRDVIDHYDHGIQDSPQLDPLLRVGLYGAPIKMNLSEDDKNALEAFLNTLTDEQMLADPKFSDPFP
jgi:cytochrome c peroxidase